MLPIRSIRFNSNISDEQLKAFFGEENVVEIVRGTRMSDVRVYSDETATMLGQRLEVRFEEWKARKAQLREAEYRARYRQWRREMIGKGWEHIRWLPDRCQNPSPYEACVLWGYSWLSLQRDLRRKN
ncbi:MAG TPA: hypothetical protein VGO43_07200 [Pyrinomonadaceae bacterium]|jgi:hypothetical protein|nr:hypothetical protein [Pyrinomonadaceae bacterium]